MTIVWLIGVYAVSATLLWTLARAKNAALPSSVRQLEDAEQMAAIGRRSSPRRVEHDPYATLS